MDSARIDDDHVQLVVTHGELQALRSALLESDEAISDDVAFSARLGVPRWMIRRLWIETVYAQRWHQPDPSSAPVRISDDFLAAEHVPVPPAGLQ
jgi:homogentisate 1,2-dioxygenase